MCGGSILSYCPRNLHGHERALKEEEEIPKSIRNNQKPTKILPKRNCKEKINTNKPPQCDSAIGLHLLQNKQCAINYNDQQFSLLDRARIEFHLSALEATYIKTLKPILCRHKVFIYS